MTDTEEKHVLSEEEDDEDDPVMGLFKQVNDRRQENKRDEKATEAILAMLEKAKKEDPIQLREAEDRNILVVGRTRSGKSTLLSVLKHTTFAAARISFFSETEEPDPKHFTMEYHHKVTVEKDGVKTKEDRVKCFNLTMIDTPGLFEQKATDGGREKTPNEKLQETIMQCLRFNVAKLHCIFFVFSLESGINRQDLEAMEAFTKLLDGAQKNISLVLTRCEAMSETKKDDLFEQMHQQEDLARFCEMVNDRVFFMGSLEDADLRAGDVNGMQTKVQNIYGLRKKLYQHIFRQSEPCLLEKLKYVKLRAEAAYADLTVVAKLMHQLRLAINNGDKEKEASLRKQAEDGLRKLAPSIGALMVGEYARNAKLVLSKAEELGIGLAPDTGDVVPMGGTAKAEAAASSTTEEKK